MTYRELNELFQRTWADDKGIIRGKPVMMIYRINMASESLDSPVDEEFVRAELERTGLTLDF